MSDPKTDSPAVLEARVQRTLERCLEWSQQGRHRRVLTEVDRLLAITGDQPTLSAQLLIWKAQALLSMGYPERAHVAARESWHVTTSPHACSLIATALNAVGEVDHAERFLMLGVDLFPTAVHLPVQLAMMLTDQGRLQEALDVLEGVRPSVQLPDEVQVFLVGLRANLLANVGRWTEADAVLEEALHRHPDSSLLLETHDAISREWVRSRAESGLAESWRDALEPIDGVAGEVDDEIVRCGMVLELPDLVVLGARRLWRAFTVVDPIRVQAPEPWGAGLIAAVLELDGQPYTGAAIARATGCKPSTVRSAAARVRSYLGRLDPGFARRAFGAQSNPRLDDGTGEPASGPGSVIRFPG
jgi:hypothetical protein